MQLSTALEGFWLSKARSLSQNTVNDYNHSYGRFIRFLANQHVEEMETVTPQHINAFLTWLDTDQCLAPKTVLNHWIALSALWTWAEKELELPQLVGRSGCPRSAQISLVRACSRGLGSCRRNDMRRSAVFMRYTGWRRKVKGRGCAVQDAPASCMASTCAPKAASNCSSASISHLA